MLPISGAQSLEFMIQNDRRSLWMPDVILAQSTR